MITVGHIVHYYPNEHDRGVKALGAGPLAAIVTQVHSPQVVNLFVFDKNPNNAGVQGATSVQFFETVGDEYMAASYCVYPKFPLYPRQ